MKVSHGLEKLLEPLAKLVTNCEDVAEKTADGIMEALKMSGKRGAGPYYPTDLKRANIVLHVSHDVTGLEIEAPVVNGDIPAAIESLRQQIETEDYILTLAGLTLHN